MDKGQKQQQPPPQRVPQQQQKQQQQQKGDKNSPSKSKSLPTTTISASQRVKSWAPHSRINKILSNLERSILNQFNGHNGSSSGISSSSSSSSSLIKTKSQAGRLKASSIGPPSSILNDTSTSLNGLHQKQKQQEQPDSNDNKRNNGHQAQRDSASASNKGITLQLKSEPAKVKTTLNKYQQQIVSTMRHNHQLILNNSNSSNCNNNKLLSNKLSIPPPHANNEARDQNHRIIFGAVAMQNTTRQSSDDNVIGSSATLRPSTGINRLAPNTTARNDSGGKQAETSNNNAAEINLIRYNASPASSAKSLPTIATKPTGSQNFNKSINEEEESGFSTYQSRRSLLANNPANISTTTASSAATGDHQNKSQNSNNMIIMQTQTQVPIGALNFNNSPQQVVYNYQLPHIKHTTYHQHQQLFANQVPITSTTTSTIDHSNKNCYPNHSSQIHHNISDTQRLSQSQFSDQQNLHNNSFPPAPPHQLFSLYTGSGMQVPVSQQVIESGQEIYANAPPKPRRYQYYDPSSSVHLFQQQMTASALANSNGSQFMANGNSSNNAIIRHHQHQQQQSIFNRQNYSHFNQQLPSNQPIYNISYLQMPNLYPQQQGIVPVQASNQHQILYNGANIHHEQQRAVNPPFTLTKSKSSLDAGDLVQYKIDAQNRSNTLRLHPQHRQQQQQQLVYGSRNNPNRYPNFPQQQGAVGSNMQRSKSVSHLLQPDYDRQQMNLQQRNLFIDNGHTTIGPKFLSVSSASTTNLNMIGLANNQQNQFSKMPIQSSSSHNQPPLQQYHDLIQQQGNQLFSSSAQRQHQRLNNWQHPQNQVSVNCNDVLSNQHQQLRQQRGSNPINNTTKTNSAFSNCGKLVRQPPQVLGEKFISEDGFGKPSLDDKIRYLMIGESDNSSNTASSTSNLIVKSSTNHQNDNNVIHHLHSSNNANLSQTAWTTKQQLSLPASESSAGNGSANSILKREIIGTQQNPNVAIHHHSPKLTHNNTSVQQKQNLANDSDLTNRIYINELAPKMGNRQQRQYQVNDIQNHSDSPPMQPGVRNNNESDAGQFKNTANSQLIVDLTTPRVLAKTQTTLSSGDIHADATQRRDSCSINQVGLPTQPMSSLTTNVSHVNHRSMTMSESRASHQQLTKSININDSINNELSSKTTFVNRTEKAPVCERTAPYYYSDLKSEEQRQALLSIVQQKSLSPPPQLLSRSTDQSSTRLALKSATLHPSHMRLLGDSLTKEQRQTRAANNNGNLNNDFSSTSNIAKNIDKLFESPAQPRINAVQSMLALNDNVKENPQSSQLSSFQATSESKSINYLSGDMKNKNFSKSKSLENINQGSSREDIICAPTMSKALGNPVYENICRTDKLMSAINNSTTCLSTSASRSKREANYIVENQHINSEESTDSILGSSLDESDSSLDLIDEIKISPTDNHLSDISQLIEQLKINHSKLSDEYKSTLVRIAKTINTKNKQTNADYKTDKLSRRLQLLELKSKKCESRSKNQLALIQMMENVLKQSKARATGSVDNSISNSLTDSSKPAMNQNHLSSTSPSLSFDYQNIKQSVTMTKPAQSYTSPTSSNSPSTLNSQHSIMSDSVRSLSEQPSIPSSSSQSIVKAIVTESEGQVKYVSEVKRADEINGQVSLSTRHHQQSLQGTNSQKGTSRGVLRNSTGAHPGGNLILSLDMRKRQTLDRNTTNPFCNDNDEDLTSSSSESSVEEAERVSRKPSKDPGDMQRLCNNDDNNKSMSVDMNQDEEDFIEFLTTDTSNRRSQFGASQFSASDFDSQANSTGSCGDSRSNSSSKNSHLTKNHLLSNGAMNTGILKSAKNGHNCLNINNNNNSNNRNNNNNGFDDMKDTSSSDRSNFTNVLGNVIDVDICPMNNLSRNSPVTTQASCLN